MPALKSPRKQVMKGSLYDEIERMLGPSVYYLDDSKPYLPPKKLEAPPTPLGIEMAPGPTVPHKALAWAESVRAKQRLASTDRRMAEWRAALDRQARERKAVEDEVAAKQAVIDEAARARDARTNGWAAQAMAAIERDRRREAMPARARWAAAEKKVEAGRGVALGGLLAGFEGDVQGKKVSS